MSSTAPGYDFKRRRPAVALAIGALTALMIALSSGASAKADGGGATVVRNPSGGPILCELPDSTWNWWVFTCRIQQVILPSGVVNEYLKGSLYAPFSTPAPAHARTDITTAETGWTCDTVDGQTTLIVGGTVTPSGNVSVTCRSS